MIYFSLSNLFPHWRVIVNMVLLNRYFQWRKFRWALFFNSSNSNNYCYFHGAESSLFSPVFQMREGSFTLTDSSQEQQLCRIGSHISASLDILILTSSSLVSITIYPYNPHFLPTSLPFTSHTSLIILLICFYLVVRNRCIGWDAWSRDMTETRQNKLSIYLYVWSRRGQSRMYQTFLNISKTRRTALMLPNLPVFHPRRYNLIETRKLFRTYRF